MLTIKNLTKKYQKKIVFENINVTLPNTGLFAIVGPSGCGKSTLLNILSCLDEDYVGEVILNGHTIKSKYKKDIGIIYQSYNLLENYSALDNVKIAALINDNYDKLKIVDLLKRLNIKEDLFNKKCCFLSGGEKQRIAIARAIVNHPKIVLADEPTGALDSKNGQEVMQILKDISKHSLVLLVSHNLELVQEYCDEVINFKDINNHTFLTEIKKDKNLSTLANKDNSFLVILKNHLFNNHFRHFLAFVSFVFTFIFTCLSLTFVLESKSFGENVSTNYYDQNVFYVSRVQKEKITGSYFSYTQYMRPSKQEIVSLKNVLPSFKSYYDLSVFYPQIVSLTSDEKTIQNVMFLPSFSLLKENEVVINSVLANMFDSQNLKIDIEKHFMYENEKCIFKRSLLLKVKDIINEVDILNSPKIYYSYQLAYNDLNNSYLLENVNKTILGAIKEARSSDELSNYQMLIVLNQHSDIKKMYQIINQGLNNYEISSNSYNVQKTIDELINAITMVLSVFEIIALISCSAITLFIVLSLIWDYQREKAILISLGKDKKSFFTMYLFEMIVLLVISIFVSAILLIIIETIINKILVGFYYALKIKILIPFLLSTVLFILLTFLVTYLSDLKLKKYDVATLLREE